MSASDMDLPCDDGQPVLAALFVLFVLGALAAVAWAVWLTLA